MLLSFSEYVPNTHGTNLLVFDKNFKLIDNIKYMKKAEQKYKIRTNTINSSCNRLTLCNKNYYFVKDKDESLFRTKYKLEAFGTDKIAMRLLDNELNN